jgi:hypothetical protein
VQVFSNLRQAPILKEIIMKAVFPIVLVTIFLVLMASPALSHHSNAIFNLESVVVLQGTVSRFDWRNPHVYIHVATTNDDGRKLEWLIETDATPILTRNGWSAKSLTPGDTVTVRANPDKNPQRNHALLLSIATPAGAILTPRSRGVATASRASNLSGVWDGIRGFNSRRFNYGALTAKGMAAQTAFSESDNPVADCVPHPAPSLATLPYLNHIEIRGNTIIIRSELFKTDRIVYMDGRRHPENNVRTNQGHSIGRWEGNVLVVDTTHFADNRSGHRLGIPSGAQKHVIERYALSDDGTRLSVSFVVEDPEYLKDPMTGSIEWDYAPQLEFVPFECDPEVSRRYTSH